MPLVSVIVPVYKVEDYLHRCIDSVLNQTYTDFELILIDDGSPDSCPQICDEYANKDNRIKVIHKTNGGQSSARNAGLEICQGAYIYFCDSDDWIEPNLLEHTVNRIVTENADIVRFQCYTHFEDTTYQSSFFLNSDSVTLRSDDDRIDFICESILSYKIGWEMCLALYRADTLISNHIQFPKGIDIAEDLYINILDTLYANRIAFLDLPLYHYRMRGDSTMGKVKGKIRLDACNELAYQLYQGIGSKAVKSNFYQIHNRMIINEMMGHLPEIKNQNIAQRYFEEVEKVTRIEFFEEQLQLAVENIDYVPSNGFLYGSKKNTLNRLLFSHDYYGYRLRTIQNNILYLPIRILRKIKRTLRKQ